MNEETDEDLPPGSASTHGHVASAANGRIMAGVRIVLGVMWLTNLGWKVPPNFGIVRNYTAEAVEHPFAAPYSWLVEEVILPNFVPFGWSVLLIESLLAVLLLLGLFTRAAALIGVVQSAAIGMSVALAPGEWPWAYYLMIAAHLAVFATAAGRVWGLDGLMRPLVADRSGRLARAARWAS